MNIGLLFKGVLHLLLSAYCSEVCVYIDLKHFHDFRTPMFLHTQVVNRTLFIVKLFNRRDKIRIYSHKNKTC